MSICENSPATDEIQVVTGRVTAETAIRIKDGFRHQAIATINDVVSRSSRVSYKGEHRCARMLNFALRSDWDTVVWAPEMWKAAVAGSEAFEGTVFHMEDIASNPMLPCIPTLWIPEVGYLPRTFEGQGEYLPQAILTSTVAGINDQAGDTRDFLRTGILDASKFTGRYGISFGFLYVSLTDPRDMLFDFLPTVYDGDTLTGVWASMIAALRFAGEPFNIVEDMPLPRNYRRRLERTGKLPRPVKTIALRARQSAVKGTSGESDREFNCQWLVGGHWRKQWYPKRGEHQPRYISPYVKGPEDKPFRAPHETVKRVCR